MGYNFHRKVISPSDVVTQVPRGRKGDTRMPKIQGERALPSLLLQWSAGHTLWRTRLMYKEIRSIIMI